MLLSFSGCVSINVSSSSSTQTSSQDSQVNQSSSIHTVPTSAPVINSNLLDLKWKDKGFGFAAVPQPFKADNISIVPAAEQFPIDIAFVVHDFNTTQGSVKAYVGFIAASAESKNTDAEAVIAALIDRGLEVESIKETESYAGNTVCYGTLVPYEIPQECADIAKQESAFLEEAAKNFVIFAIPKYKFDYTVMDMYGNTVNTTDILATKDFTVLNFWTSWCPNCAKEMGELSELDKTIREKNGQVLLVLLDAKTTSDETFKTAMDVLAQYGGEDLYCILATDKMNEDTDSLFDAIPASFIADKDANVTLYNFDGQSYQTSEYLSWIDRVQKVK